jgi:uncharacterized membrane protein
VISNGQPFLTILLVLVASVIGRLVLEEAHAHRGVMPRRWVWAGAALTLAALTPIWWWSGTEARARLPAGQPVTDLAVGQIIGQRCASCHSEQPTFPDIAAPPKGVVFTAETLSAYAQRINLMIGSGNMPPGNVTGFTDAERMALLHWTEQQRD